MSDLRQRVPGHSLIDQLLREWDQGTIHFGRNTNEIVIDEEARGWYWGVLGERRIAELLSALGPEWVVLHSVPAGVNGRDIDHIAIGPAGVFTINTKYHPGKKIWAAGYGLMIDGFKHSEYLQAATREVLQARNVLTRAVGWEVPVAGVIVFVDPRSLTRKAPAGGGKVDLRIHSDRDLVAGLSGPPVLTAEQVAEVAAAASLPGTWLRAPEPSTIGDHISREFAALEDAVGGSMGGRASRPPVRRARTAPPSRSRHGSTRPAKSAPRGRRPRKKASTLDRLFTRVIVPVAAFGWLWFWLTQVYGK